MPFLVTRSERRLLSHKTTISCKPSNAFCNDGPTRSDTPRVTASCRWCSCGFQQLAVPQQSAAYQIQCQTSQSRCTESAMADNLRIVAAMSRASAKTLPRITLPADASFEISVGIHTGILEFLVHSRVLQRRIPLRHLKKRQTCCRAQTILRTRATSLKPHLTMLALALW